MTKILALGDGTPGGGEIDGQDDFSFQELGDVLNANANLFSITGRFGVAGGTATTGVDVTVGTKFTATKAVNCTGLKFGWTRPSADKTVRCKLWQATELKSVDVAVTADGIYTATFSTPQLLTAFQEYHVSVYVTDAGKAYTKLTLFAEPIKGFVQGNAFALIQSYCRYANGNALPDNTSSTEVFTVEPVLVEP